MTFQELVQHLPHMNSSVLLVMLLPRSLKLYQVWGIGRFIEKTSSKIIPCFHIYEKLCVNYTYDEYEYIHCTSIYTALKKERSGVIYKTHFICVLCYLMCIVLCLTPQSNDLSNFYAACVICLGRNAPHSELRRATP